MEKDRNDPECDGNHFIRTVYYTSTATGLVLATDLSHTAMRAHGVEHESESFDSDSSGTYRNHHICCSEPLTLPADDDR